MARRGTTFTDIVTRVPGDTVMWLSVDSTVRWLVLVRAGSPNGFGAAPGDVWADEVATETATQASTIWHRRMSMRSAYVVHDAGSTKEPSSA